ncbi:hypothetical protein MKX03_031018 [Papaver bracteatum]|nr:hypothetical protein MKX03_031018 [Papaver bracteatum]
MEVGNRYVTLKNQLERDEEPKETDFEFKTSTISLNLYVSIDPYQINRMKKRSSSHKAINFAFALSPGQSCGIYKLSFLRKLETTIDLPLSHQVGVLGLSGLTAYGGFYNVGRPKKGDKVFVSAASGSVRNLVGQYAKLSDKLGFDDAFNYKDEPDLPSALQRYFPDGIDIYFDNVGSEMLEAAIVNMNTFGRVVVCGVMSEYTDETKRAAPNMMDITYNYIRNAKLHVLEDISVGLESIPSAFVGIFRGDNIGKKMVQIV